MTVSTIRLLLGLLCLLVLGSTTADAQRYGSRKKKEPLFGAGVLIGPSFSQIDGDKFTGYSKVGIYGGAQAIVRFDKRNQLRIGLLYHQKGNRVESRNEPNYRDKDRIMELNYAEVPFIFYHRLTYNELNSRATILEAGLAYGRLLGTRFEEIETRIDTDPYESLLDEFSRNEVSAVIGLSYQINKNFGVGFRSTMALKKYYVNPVAQEPDPLGRRQAIKFLRNYGFAILASYTL